MSGWSNWKNSKCIVVSTEHGKTARGYSWALQIKLLCPWKLCDVLQSLWAMKTIKHASPNLATNEAQLKFFLFHHNPGNVISLRFVARRFQHGIGLIIAQSRCFQIADGQLCVHTGHINHEFIFVSLRGRSCGASHCVVQHKQRPT